MVKLNYTVILCYIRFSVRFCLCEMLTVYGRTDRMVLRNSCLLAVAVQKRSKKERKKWGKKIQGKEGKSPNLILDE